MSCDPDLQAVLSGDDHLGRWCKREILRGVSQLCADLHVEVDQGAARLFEVRSIELRTRFDPRDQHLFCRSGAVFIVEDSAGPLIVDNPVIGIPDEQARGKLRLKQAAQNGNFQIGLFLEDDDIAILEIGKEGRAVVGKDWPESPDPCGNNRQLLMSASRY